MGGARCSYKNCTVRSDGKTHMFHYPVFEKVRCNKWLKNAGRWDFLNLKVSQVKNRMVCQHHFTDDSFMNHKRDKLRFSAVPTENGPYCNSDEWIDKEYPISIEDIENDLNYNHKKDKKVTMKYGEFLTNCDLIDLDCLKTTDHHFLIKTERSDNQELNQDVISNKSLFGNVGMDNKIEIIIGEPHKPPDTLNNQNNGQCLNESKLNVMHKNITENQIKMNGIGQPLHSKKLLPINRTKSNHIQQSVGFTELSKKTKVINEKVKIVSQKNLSEPILVKGELIPISPSKDISLHSSIKDEVGNEVLSERTIEVNKKTKKLKQSESREILNSKLDTNYMILNHSVADSKNNSLHKKAILEEKRKHTEDSEQEPAKKIKTKHNNPENVECFSPKDSDLLNIQKDTVTCLEAQIKRLEESLLNKIDQNTERIMELKNSLTHCNSVTKSVHTQTTCNEVSEKKRLYREISKYLSPEINSLIYEELFINKYALNASLSSTQSLKRGRR